MRHVVQTGECTDVHGAVDVTKSSLLVLSKEPQAVQGIGALLIFPLAFISNIFVPVDTMPDWMQTIAEANPVGHLVDTVRGLWMGGPVSEPLLLTLAWMVGILIVFVPLSLIAYLRRARE